MKRLIYFTAAVLLVTSAACKDEVGKPTRKDLIDPSIVHDPQSINGIDPKEAATLPTMDFTDSLHNFGDAKEGEKLTYEFSFTNNGKTPLLISGAHGSCGCTVADYPREPIAPGKSGVVKAIFNTEGKPGHQDKTVTISNNTARGMQLVVIQADVAPAKD